MEHELRAAIASHLWSRLVDPDPSKIADEVVPFLLAHYDIAPKRHNDPDKFVKQVSRLARLYERCLISAQEFTNATIEDLHDGYPNRRITRGDVGPTHPGSST